MTLSEQHMNELREAKRVLEHPGLVARLADVVGMPVEKAMASLPAKWSERISAATRKALNVALDIAVKTLDKSPETAIPGFHGFAVAVTGAAGGAFGLAALPLELPVSTTVMLRSIADIARSNGENLDTTEARLACLMVFSLGGKAASDNGAESGYFAARAALAKAVSEATSYIAEKGIAAESAPAIVRLVTQIAARFNIQVTQKAAAMAVPVIGAASGALINTLFINHFNDMARGHFTVRRLERFYGQDVVDKAYLDMCV